MPNRIHPRRRALALALLPAAAAAASMPEAAAAESVTFPGRDAVLQAELLRPPGPGPFPAVVALHGCAGLYGRGGSLSPRHADWAARLVTAGFMVLLPDSFGSRGLGPQCKVGDRTTSPSRERKADAFAAKAYLQSRGDVKPASVSLVGWSNGGSAVLYAVGRRPSWDSGPDFAAAVAFYPGCRTPLETGDWHARLPLLLLTGAADDWTPPGPCQVLAAQAQARHDPMSLVLYPNAYHDFDHPNLPVHVVGGLAFTATGSGVAHTGTNAAARADALRRVPAFLPR